MFERGAIDDNLYIMLGTAELHAPLLKDCPDDIPILAQQYAVDAVTEQALSAVPRIDRTGRDFLKEQAWSANHQELRDAVWEAVRLSNGDVLTAENFSGTSTEAGETVQPSQSFTSKLLFDRLQDYRDSYLRGILKFAGDDTRVASDLLSVDERLFQNVREEDGKLDD